ncbi:MAG TPA: RNA-binding cell elongation regulator Jag/EloR [Limnochorda sp.]
MSAPRFVVKSGRNVQEALEAALDELGVGRDDVVVEVLDEGNKGLLGWLGGRLARIRVTVKEPQGTTPQATGAPAASGSTGGKATPVRATQADGSEGLERGRAFLREVIRLMGVGGVVETHRMGPGFYKLNIVSEGAGLLIGHRGETLNALQYLVNLAANRKREGEPVRFVLDAGDYRRRREAALREMALRTARRVRREKRRVALEPMNAMERRIIHLALKDDPYVETRSEGEEPNRRVVIFPKGQASGSASQNRRAEDRGREPDEA